LVGRTSAKLYFFDDDIVVVERDKHKSQFLRANDTLLQMSKLERVASSIEKSRVWSTNGRIMILEQLSTETQTQSGHFVEEL
jgi:hypothetical protein